MEKHCSWIDEKYKLIVKKSKVKVKKKKDELKGYLLFHKFIFKNIHAFSCKKECNSIQIVTYLIFLKYHPI